MCESPCLAFYVGGMDENWSLCLCLWHLYIESTRPDPYLYKNIMVGVLRGLVHVVELKMYPKGKAQ